MLLVHGIADGAAGWREVSEALSGEARVIAYDRRGYGGSEAPEPYERTTVEEQAEDAAMLLRGLDAGARRRVRARPGRGRGARPGQAPSPSWCAAVALVDPALYQLAPDATRGAVGRACRAREARCATAARRTRSRPGWPRGARRPTRIARARGDHVAFFADYAGLATWPVLRRDLRALDVPVAVLVSAGAPAYVRETGRALAELVPGATLRARGRARRRPCASCSRSPAARPRTAIVPPRRARPATSSRRGGEGEEGQGEERDREVAGVQRGLALEQAEEVGRRAGWRG